MGDVVYLKLTESKMGQNWRVSKVEGVKTGSDGYVCQVIIAYKDTSGDSTQDWFHRTVEWPVRNVIELFNINETLLMDEINQVYQMAGQYLKFDEARFISKKPN